jgi:hypothetical protein
MPRLIVRGAIPQLPYTSSWRVSQLIIGIILSFPLVISRLIHCEVVPHQFLMYLCLSLYRDSQSAFELFVYQEISEQWAVQEINVRSRVRHRKTPKCAVIALRYVGLTLCCGQCGGRVHSRSV